MPGAGISPSSTPLFPPWRALGSLARHGWKQKVSLTSIVIYLGLMLMLQKTTHPPALGDPDINLQGTYASDIPIKTSWKSFNKYFPLSKTARL